MLVVSFESFFWPYLISLLGFEIFMGEFMGLSVHGVECSWG